MKLFFRILLFVLCIHSTPAFSIEIVNTPDPATGFDTLTDNFVQIEIPNETNSAFSILRSVDKLLSLVQEKYYSLLNWKTYSRTKPLQILKYNRTGQFGTWINDPNDQTCYNTRALVLIRDSVQEVTFSDTNHCSVVTGKWNDPYTGQNFTKREDIQIDHVVPLKNAYDSGAYRWNFKARCLYANYLGYDFHLMSVNGSQNMKKGDKGPDKYMPPNSEHACLYLKHWLTIKFLWGLRMTVPEATAITQALKDNKCNTYNFRVVDSEIKHQNEFANENIDLCTNVDPSN